MTPRVDERHLAGLLGSAGRSLARQPGAKDLIDRVRRASSPRELGRALEGVDLGVEPEARAVVTEALTRGPRWEEMHALLVRSAEQSFRERFDSGA